MWTQERRNREQAVGKGTRILFFFKFFTVRVESIYIHLKYQQMHRFFKIL